MKIVIYVVNYMKFAAIIALLGGQQPGNSNVQLPGYSGNGSEARPISSEWFLEESHSSLHLPPLRSRPLNSLMVCRGPVESKLGVF